MSQSWATCNKPENVSVNTPADTKLLAGEHRVDCYKGNEVTNEYVIKAKKPKQR